MGGCAGKLNVPDITRFASLPRQISFSRTKTKPQNSDPQVNGKEEGEKVENKVGGNEDISGGEEKKEAPLVDLSMEGEKSSSDQPKTDAAAADSAVQSKVETTIEDNATPSSTENKVETPVSEVIDNATPDNKAETPVSQVFDNATPDNKVETFVTNSTEDKAETIASNSEGNKVEIPVPNSDAAVVVGEEAEVKQPEAVAVNEPEAKLEAAAKPTETVPANAEDKTDAAHAAQ